MRETRAGGLGKHKSNIEYRRLVECTCCKPNLIYIIVERKILLGHPSVNKAKLPPWLFPASCHDPAQAMGDKEPQTVFPASKLGEYTVIKDIAEGTFGKVKSK
jgi:hypothetical protein